MAEDSYFVLQQSKIYQIDIFTEVERTEGLAVSEPDALYVCKPKNIVSNNRHVFNAFC